MSIKGAARPNARGDDHEPEEYARGRRDGIAWARDYATPDELSDLVKSFEPGGGGEFDQDHSLHAFMSDKEHPRAGSVPRHDDPFWRGFIAGAEEVLDDASPPVKS